MSGSSFKLVSNIFGFHVDLAKVMGGEDSFSPYGILKMIFLLKTNESYITSARS